MVPVLSKNVANSAQISNERILGIWSVESYAPVGVSGLADSQTRRRFNRVARRCRVVLCRAVPCRAVPCRAAPHRAAPCRCGGHVVQGVAWRGRADSTGEARRGEARPIRPVGSFVAGFFLCPGNACGWRAAPSGSERHIAPVYSPHQEEWNGPIFVSSDSNPRARHDVGRHYFDAKMKDVSNRLQ